MCFNFLGCIWSLTRNGSFLFYLLSLFSSILLLWSRISHSPKLATNEVSKTNLGKKHGGNTFCRELLSRSCCGRRREPRISVGWGKTVHFCQLLLTDPGISCLLQCQTTFVKPKGDQKVDTELKTLINLNRSLSHLLTESIIPAKSTLVLSLVKFK